MMLRPGGTSTLLETDRKRSARGPREKRGRAQLLVNPARALREADELTVFRTGFFVAWACPEATVTAAALAVEPSKNG